MKQSPRRVGGNNKRNRTDFLGITKCTSEGHGHVIKVRTLSMLVCFSLATFSCLCVDKEWEESRVNQMLRLYHANMIKKRERDTYQRVMIIIIHEIQAGLGRIKDVREVRTVKRGQDHLILGPDGSQRMFRVQY